MSRSSRSTTPAETVPDAADQRTGEPFGDPAEPPAEDQPVQEDVVEADRPASVVQEAPELEGEHYQRGYVGTLPDADNRPDLTLAGVLGLSSAPSGAPEAPAEDPAE